jgi:cyclic-di-GMP-binding biofilm dispersal mediator protein
MDDRGPQAKSPIGVRGSGLSPVGRASAEVQLRGASVLLVGASGGIGTALARELHLRGARMTLVGRDPAKLAAVDVPGQREAADLTMPGECARVVQIAAAEAGPEGLSVVLNACGAVAFGVVAESSLEIAEQLFRVNVLAAIALAQASLAALRPGGAILNISGAVADTPLAGMAAYSASKAALRAFDTAFAREARRAGIRVIDARPGHVATELSAHPLAGTPPRLGEGIPPAHVAQVICEALEAGSLDLAPESFATGEGRQTS